MRRPPLAGASRSTAPSTASGVTSVQARVAGHRAGARAAAGARDVDVQQLVRDPPRAASGPRARWARRARRRACRPPRRGAPGRCCRRRSRRRRRARRPARASVVCAAEVGRRRSPATYAVSARSPGPPVTDHAARADERRDELAVALGRPRPRGHRRARDGRRRSRPAMRQTATVAAVCAARRRRRRAARSPAARDEVERALDLVHVVVDLVAQVEQRAREVDRLIAPIRGTPASRSSSASGQRALVERAEDHRAVDAERGDPGDERVDVAAVDGIGRRGRSTARARRAPRRRRAAAAAAWRPRGPHSSVTRSAPRGERADGRAGEQHVARRCPAGRRARGSRRRSDAERGGTASAGAAAAASEAVERVGQVGGDRLGRRRDLLAPGDARRHEDRPGARRARGLDVGADVADHRARARVDAERAPPRAGCRPGAGLRQAQPSSGPCGQTRAVPSGPSSSSIRALTARDLRRRRAGRGRCRSGWRRRRAGTPAARSRSSACARRGIGSTRVGVAVVGHVDDRACRRGRRARPSGAAAGPRRGARRRRRAATSAAATKGIAALVHAMVATSRARARAGRDRAPTRARRCRRATCRRGRRDEPRGARPRARPATRAAARDARRSGGGGECAGTGRGDGEVTRPAAGGDAGALAPVAAVEAAHQRVVGVAGLLAHARSTAGRTRRGATTRRCPRTIRQPARDDPQAEVGVLAVGAREALVEAADGLERRRAGRPCRRWPSARARGPRRCAPSRSAGGRAAAARRSGPGAAPTSRAGRARSRASAARQPGGGSTSSSRKATHSARAARQPALRAAAGPRAGPRARTRDAGAAPAAAEPRSAAGRRRRSRAPARPALRSASSSARSDGRPDVGMTIVVAHADAPSARAAARAGRRRRTGRSPAASTGAEPKHSSASRGSSTIGRPAVFRDVLTTTGTPVRASKASSMRATSGSSARSTVWIARGAVDVHHGRDPVAPLLAHAVGEEHVRRRDRPVTEDLARALRQHHRRDRAELLAALDVVEPLEVLRPPRVGEQRAVPERARPELGAALEPRDDAVVGEHLGDRVGDVVGPLELDARRVAAPPRARRRPSRARARPCASARACRPARAPPAARHPSAVPASPDAGCTQTRLERPFPPQPRVRHAVQRDAAGEHQIAVARPLVQPRRELEQHLLEPPLHGGGQRGVVGRELARPARAAGRSARSRGPPPPGTRRTPSARTSSPELVEERRLPVGSHRHHLVLVATSGGSRGAPSAPRRAARASAAGPARRSTAKRRRRRTARPGRSRARRGRRAPAPSMDRTPEAKVADAACATWCGTQRNSPSHPVEHRPQEQRRPLRVERPQPFPVLGGDVDADRPAQARVVGVGDRVEVGGRQPGAPTGTSGSPARAAPTWRTRRGSCRACAGRSAPPRPRRRSRRRPPARRRDRGKQR